MATDPRTLELYTQAKASEHSEAMFSLLCFAEVWGNGGNTPTLNCDQFVVSKDSKDSFVSQLLCLVLD